MRMRVIVETDFAGTRKEFRDRIKAALHLGDIHRSIPGEIVYVAIEIAETAVVSHDGKTLTKD